LFGTSSIQAARFPKGLRRDTAKSKGTTSNGAFSVTNKLEDQIPRRLLHSQLTPKRIQSYASGTWLGPIVPLPGHPEVITAHAPTSCRISDALRLRRRRWRGFSHACPRTLKHRTPSIRTLSAAEDFVSPDTASRRIPPAAWRNMNTNPPCRLDRVRGNLTSMDGHDCWSSMCFGVNISAPSPEATWVVDLLLMSLDICSLEGPIPGLWKHPPSIR